MRVRKTKWLWLAAVLLFVVALLAVFPRNPGPAGISVSFISYTNAPNDPHHLPFALLSVTNNDRMPIRCRGVMSEIEGGLDNLAPTVNSTLPRFSFAEMKPGQGTVFAVGQPTDATGRWRIHYLYERKTLKQRLRDYVMRRAGTVPFSWLHLSSTVPLQLTTNTSAWIKAETR